MTLIDFQTSPYLGAVILQLITSDAKFRAVLIANNPSMTADIESASVNHTCSCKNRVLEYVGQNANDIGALLFQYAESTNKLSDVAGMFTGASANAGQSASGRVAKTTVSQWPEFVKSIQQSNLTFSHMSTSIVGDDVYVFFI